MRLERGLPSVPRGLSRELATYLQALQTVVLSVAGLGRGNEEKRALRAPEKTNTERRELRRGEVLTANLADGSVSADKLAAGCVTEKKIAPSAVTAKAIKGGAVGADALAALCVGNGKLADRCVEERNIEDGSVTRAKLGADCRLTIQEGKALDGELVELAGFAEEPLAVMTGFWVETGGKGVLRAGIREMEKTDRGWSFTAEARLETEAKVYKGGLRWRAYGRSV